MKKQKYIVVFALTVAVIGGVFAWLLDQQDAVRFEELQFVRQQMNYHELYGNSCTREYVTSNNTEFIELSEELFRAASTDLEAFAAIVSDTQDTNLLLTVYSTFMTSDTIENIDLSLQVLLDSGLDVFDVDLCAGSGKMIYSAISTNNIAWLEPLLSYSEISDDTEHHFVEYAIDFCALDSLGVLLRYGYQPDYGLFDSVSVGFEDFAQFECPKALESYPQL